MELHVGKHSGIQHDPCQSAYGRRFFNHFVEQNQSESNMAAASGQMVDQWSFWRLTSGSSPHVESDFAQTQKMSFAFRLNYSYKSKYLFNFSTRWDGVSQFSAGHKWDAFPAGAIAWRISDRLLWKDTKLAGQPETESQLRHHGQLRRNRRLQHHYPSLRIFCQRSLRQWKNRSFHTILGDLRQHRPRLGKIVQLEHRSRLRHTEQPHRRFH